MNSLALSACAVIALSLPGFSQSMSWDTSGTQGDNGPGNELVFGNGAHGFTATSWGYTAGKRNQAFEAGMSVIYSNGIGVTNADEKNPFRIPEHQLDNAKGNEWMLFVFEGPVSDVSIKVDPYGTWDRDVTYYTANLSGQIDLAGLTYADLEGLGFGERTDDFSTRGGDSRDVSVSGGGTFNAILIGAMQGKPGGKRDVDRFKISSLDATYLVPEPSSALLGGLGALLLLRRRER
ncbi:hypothetical protein [Luteolibacter sp. Populi]|uniref:hypothetical protein n=1 Tax=Luteolibacter sp. Populi TaxID=3230487 RepID=UPI003466F301